ncbi:hypothetical protein PFISCL1PPCAC_27900, partial [Pristionchus fissidentatus]
SLSLSVLSLSFLSLSLQCNSVRSSSSLSSLFSPSTPWLTGQQRRRCATHWCDSARDPPPLPISPPNCPPTVAGSTSTAWHSMEPTPICRPPLPISPHPPSSHRFASNLSLLLLPPSHRDLVFFCPLRESKLCCETQIKSIR